MAHVRNLILVVLVINFVNVEAQEVIELYKGVIPNNKEDIHVKEHNLPSTDGVVRAADVSEPTLYAYFPTEKLNTGRAVIICPGGAYKILAMNKEGYDVAERFVSVGITAFVLKYRLPNDEVMIHKDIAPLQDAQRAIQLVRENAKKWKIKSDQIGIVGFSAGGHLASTLGTHYQRALIDNSENISLRPDFMLLLYPVISMRPELANTGSKKNLLGDQPTEEQVINFSNELQVTDDTPPAFIVHAADDKGVLIANSEQFRDALRKHQIDANLLVYPEGGHGFGLNNPTTPDQWFEHFLEWLNHRK